MKLISTLKNFKIVLTLKYTVYVNNNSKGTTIMRVKSNF